MSAETPLVELHQHVDGSIPVATTWELMQRHDLAPVDTVEAMERLLALQPEEEGSLLAYLDKFHYPLWITQFYENIVLVTERIVQEAYDLGVRVLELRYSPVIHTYAGLTLRQSIAAVLSGLNHAADRLDGIAVGLVVIAMRQHGPHLAKILARQATSESERFHTRSGVVGFDIAGAERGNPPRLFREAYEVARSGGLFLTCHAGEDEGPENVWQAVDALGVNRVGHGCSAVQDPELVKRLARDRILVECCLTSNRQTGSVAEIEQHPIFTFLEAGVPVAICTDNTTVSGTDLRRENELVARRLGRDVVEEIHRAARQQSFIAAVRGEDS
ncbi:MAG: adenosine deaminase [Acidobacteriota bacterium]|jgi:adenosine deaminase